MKQAAGDCPCGSGASYAACCAPLHAGERIAASAEVLMRSCYSAYVLCDEAYLMSTWHPSTRPASLDLQAEDCKWLGLTVKAARQQDETHATVEFVARYRVAGRGHRLHELSEFVCVDGRWLYIEGVFPT